MKILAVKVMVWIRSICLGWLTLLGIVFLNEGTVIRWTASLWNPGWIATVHLGFDCAAMTAAGFVAGRLNRSRPMWTAALLAATFCFWDFGDAIALNVRWLLRLAADSMQDSRYLDSLASSLETHALLFGCLFAGAMLSRPQSRPLSIGEI